MSEQSSCGLAEQGYSAERALIEQWLRETTDSWKLRSNDDRGWDGAINQWNVTKDFKVNVIEPYVTGLVEAYAALLFFNGASAVTAVPQLRKFFGDLTQDISEHWIPVQLRTLGITDDCISDYFPLRGGSRISFLESYEKFFWEMEVGGDQAQWPGILPLVCAGSPGDTEKALVGPRKWVPGLSVRKPERGLSLPTVTAADNERGCVDDTDVYATQTMRDAAIRSYMRAWSITEVKLAARSLKVVYQDLNAWKLHRAESLCKSGQSLKVQRIESGLRLRPSSQT